MQRVRDYFSRLTVKYSLYFWAESFAFLIGLFTYRTIRNSPLQHFPLFLGVIVLFEFGVIQNWFTIRHSNLWAVNFITTFQFVFYSLYLKSIVEGEKNKQNILRSMVIILLLVVINMGFFQGFWKLNSYTLLLFSVHIVYWVCFFFWKLLNFAEDQLALLSYSHFWISTGLLFFYVIGFTYFSVFGYMAYIGDYGYSSLTRLLLTIVNVILYSFISIGLLCQHRIHRS